MKRHAKTTCRPQLEQLEGRIVLSSTSIPSITPAIQDSSHKYDVPFISSADDTANHETYEKVGLEGVGQLNVVTYNALKFTCTATLLPTGYHLLTAAHCIHGTYRTDNDGVEEKIPFVAESGNVRFMVSSGDVEIPVTNMVVHPDWNRVLSNGSDIAVVELAHAAPLELQRYSLYRADSEIGQSSMRVGFGNVGTGSEGWTDNTSGTQRFGWNRYDADGGLFPFDSPITAGTQLALDFDNGLAANDAMGRFFGLEDLGLGDFEVNPTPGDSGGPTFIDGMIAGVTSYGIGRPSGVTTDIDTVINASYGEVAFDTRVAHFAGWVDQQTGIKIIDDGDASPFYVETGSWYSSQLEGFQADSRYSYGGSAIYNFTDLSHDWYEVSINIPTHSGSAETATYHFDGLGEIHVDQRSGSNGWKALGLVDARSGEISLNVSRDSSGALRADGVRIAPIKNMHVVDNSDQGYTETGSWWNSGLEGLQNGTRFSTSGTATFDFESLNEGWYQVFAHVPSHSTSSDRAIYTIMDSNDQALSIVSLDQRGASDRWQPLDIVPVAADGKLQAFLSQGGSGYLRSDAIAILQVPGPSHQTIDDGDTNGFSVTGSWPASGLTGYNNDSHYSYGGTATYTFGNLSAGWYEVLTNTPGHSGSSNRAVYSIQPGSDPSNSIVTTIDQRTGTNGWHSLETVELSDGQLGQIQVNLSQGGNGAVRTDAVRIRRVAEPSYMTIDNGDSEHSESSGWLSSGLTGYQTDSRFTYNQSATASYTFDSLTPGWYQIYVNTPGSSSNTNLAIYSISGETSAVQTVGVDQRPGSNGWQRISTFELNDHSLNVIMSNGGSGPLRADAVRVERISSFFDEFAAELEEYIAGQESEVWSGTSQSFSSQGGENVGVAVSAQLTPQASSVETDPPPSQPLTELDADHERATDVLIGRMSDFEVWSLPMHQAEISGSTRLALLLSWANDMSFELDEIDDWDCVREYRTY